MQNVGFRGDIEYDPDKPDGTPRKLLDLSRLTKQGWQPKIDLQEGIRDIYEWYFEAGLQ
jgi:nucleoside-diphosphate-sugar epimerase